MPHHCPRCRSARVKKDGRRPVGRQRFRCHTCRRTFTTRTYTPFARHRWPTGVILRAVRWYFGYRLSAADVRACLVKVRVNLFVGLGYAEDLIVMAFFGRNASKTEEATPKNSSH